MAALVPGIVERYAAEEGIKRAKDMGREEKAGK
jgi:hypothetical protein